MIPALTELISKFMLAGISPTFPGLQLKFRCRVSDVSEPGSLIPATAPSGGVADLQFNRA